MFSWETQWSGTVPCVPTVPLLFLRCLQLSASIYINCRPDPTSTNLKIAMLCASTFNVIESFDEILDQLRGAHGKPLTDTSSFFITAALLTVATELAGVREQVEGFFDGAALVEFTDLDDSEDFDNESVLPISTRRDL
jgi:hypothetical protein